MVAPTPEKKVFSRWPSRRVRGELPHIGTGRRRSLARLGRQRRRWLGLESCRGRRGLPRIGAGRRRSLARPDMKKVFLLGVDRDGLDLLV